MKFLKHYLATAICFSFVLESYAQKAAPKKAEAPKAAKAKTPEASPPAAATASSAPAQIEDKKANEAAALEDKEESPKEVVKGKEVQKEAPKAIDFTAKDVWNKDLFESDDNKVLVIQDRKYNKTGRLETGFDLGMTSATAFYNSYTAGVRAAYFFNEYWGLQWFGNYSMSTASREKEQLDNYFEASNFTTRKEYKQPRLFTGLGVLWNPIYGKFAWFRSRIIHFDIYAGLGLSYLTTESSLDFTYSGQRYKGIDDSAIGTLANLGIRIYLAKGWAWTTEIRNNIFKAQYARTRTGGGTSEIAPKDVMQNNFQFVTGVSYLFNIGGY